MQQFVVTQPALDWQSIVGIAGDLLWLLAYILTIRIGFKEKAFGIPMLAICFNFSWEVIYVLLEPSQNSLKYYLDLSWLLADTVIVYQLIRFGRNLQPVPQMRKHFHTVLVTTMVFCFVGQLTYHKQYLKLDPFGYDSAFEINLMMSILFIFLFFDRQNMVGSRSLRGLSYGAAWAKMLGTGVLSLGSFIGYLHEGGYHGYMEFLFASIFICDLFYIYLLHTAQTETSEPPSALRAEA